MNAVRITAWIATLCALIFLTRVGVGQPLEIRMSVEGVHGDNGVPGEDAWLLAYAHSITVPTDLATGRPTGVRLHEPVSVVKWVNAGTPEFLKRLTTTAEVGSVEFKFYRTSPTGMEEVYLEVALENVRVVFSSIDKAWVGSVPVPEYALPVEQVLFIYERIRWRYLDGGIEYSDTWTRPTGKVDGGDSGFGSAVSVRDVDEVEVFDREGRRVELEGLGGGPATLARIFTSLPAGEYTYRAGGRGTPDTGAVSIPVRRRSKSD